MELSGGTLTGNLYGTNAYFNNISATTLSGLSVYGNTLYSGNTPLNSLFTTFSYVDSLALGIIWQQPLELINVVADSSTPQTGATNDAFIIKTGGNTGVWSGFSAGDLIQYQNSGWVLIKSLIIGDRFGISFKSSTLPYGAFSGANNYIVTITGGTAGAFTYLLESPVNNWGVYVDNQNAYYRNISFAFSNSLNEWVQLSAGLDYVFSSGLTVVGNVVTSTYISGTSFTNNILTLKGSDNVNLLTLINNFSGITSNSISATSISANTFVSGGTNLLDIINNVRFSGGSGNCITDLYTTNIYGCSPVTIHDNLRLLNGLNVTANTVSNTVSATSITGLSLYTNSISVGSLSANTISATTYYNLPLDITITGGSANRINNNTSILFTNNTGGTFNVSGFIDTFITGGTYNNSNGIITLINNSGNTVNVSGLFKPSDDIYISGVTLNSGNYDLTLNRNDGNSYTVNLGLLSSDVTITGGTYNSNSGIVTFTNNTGGTFNVSGFVTGLTDTLISSFTYNNNNKFTITDSSGGTFNAIINVMSGLTVNGNTTTNTLSATSISANTLYVSGYTQIGVMSANTSGLGLLRIAQGSSFADFGERNSGTFGIWGQQALPTSTNYSILMNNSELRLNSLTTISLYTSAVARVDINNNRALFYTPISATTISGATIIGDSLSGNGLTLTGDISLTSGNRSISTTGGNLRLNAASGNRIRFDVGGNEYASITNTLATFNTPITGNTISATTVVIGGSGVNGDFSIKANNGSTWFNVNTGIVSFNSAGGTTQAGGVDLGARFNIQPVNDSSPALAIRGATPFTSDLIRVSSSGLTSGDIFKITGSGNTIARSISATTISANTIFVNSNTTGYFVDLRNTANSVALKINNSNNQIELYGGSLNYPALSFNGATGYGLGYGSNQLGLFAGGSIGTLFTTTAVTINNNLIVSTGYTSLNTLTATSAVISSTTQNTLLVYGSGSTNPIFSVQGSNGELFSVTDSLEGSLFSVNDISGLPIIEAFSDNTVLIGSYQAPALNTTVKITLTAGTNSIYSIPTSAYTGAFFDYTLMGSSGARAGNIMSIWSGSTTQYSETSTSSIGTTAGITFSVGISGNYAVLSSSATTSGSTVRCIIRSI